jgi:hypothetical protein
MLAQFALVVFGIFGIMALAIDMGIVTLTRVQMQNAADAAAIEGLRQRDGLVGALADECSSLVGAEAQDCHRRVAARDVVRWIFDDDFDPDAGEIVDRQLGAGPATIFPNEDGVGNLDASRLLLASEIPADRVYKPILQHNAGNASRGDMVSGTFFPNSSPVEFGETACEASADPNCPYQRADFAPSLAPGPDDAFLVRIRRTRYSADQEPGVSSNGGPLDLIFGRGTTVHEDPDSGYSVRRDGLTVRGTAIAQVRPALRAGPAVLGPPVAPSVLQIVAVPGVTPFAITDVAPLTLDTAVVAAIDVTGSISVGGGEVAHFVGPVNTMTVGDPLPPPVAPLCDPTAPTNDVANTTIWFGPLFDATRLIRFVPLQFTWDCANASSITITRRSQIVAHANASALLPEGLPVGAELPPLDAGTLMAPVLAR